MTGEAGVLSRSVVVDSLPAEGTTVVLKADAADCARLAADNGIVGIRELVGSFKLRPLKPGGVHVTGTVRAAVTQTCVVTIEPFETDLAEEVDVTFLPEKGIADWLSKRSTAVVRDDAFEDEDPPDPIVDGRIELGALMAEFLALGLDPYPRKPGAAFDPGPEPVKDPSPFAALAALKRDP